MDTNKMRVLLQGAAKIFEAGLRSKTWDIHGMPHFITTTHREGMWGVRSIHFARSRSVKGANSRNTAQGGWKKAFQTAWPNIIHHIEDEASSVSDKKVEWYSNRHNNLTDDVKMAENKASVEWDCHWKADEKLAQATVGNKTVQMFGSFGLYTEYIFLLNG